MLNSFRIRATVHVDPSYASPDPPVHNPEYAAPAAPTIGFSHNLGHNPVVLGHIAAGGQVCEV